MRRTLYRWLAAAALAAAGCGPDAPRDNPLDVPSTGVYGTVYRRSGGVLAGAAVAASPANRTVVSDGQGGYALELPGGTRQTLLFTAADRDPAAFEIDVPARGLVQQNVIMNGRLAVDTARVTTALEVKAGGSEYRYITPCLVARHPDGRSFLDGYTYRYQIDTCSLPPGSAADRDGFSRAYCWQVDSVVLGVGNFGAYVAGRLTRFAVTSPDYSLILNRYVPAFLEPPSGLAPSGGSPFWPPDTLRWTNAQSDVDIRIEVWQGATMVWSKDTTNVSRAVLPLSLAPGGYLWKVRGRDVNGNSSQAEATFIRP